MKFQESKKSGEKNFFFSVAPRVFKIWSENLFVKRKNSKQKEEIYLFSYSKRPDFR